MAIKKILSYPENRDILKSKSKKVNLEDTETKQILQHLKDTLLNMPNGIGLAAPQIGKLKRIFALRKDYIIENLEKNSVFIKKKTDVLFFINPKIISKKGEVLSEEGCLSIPEKSVKIKRAKTVKVKGLTEEGEKFYEKFTGLAAIAVQQEMDHLNGTLIIDYN